MNTTRLATLFLKICLSFSFLVIRLEPQGGPWLAILGYALSRRVVSLVSAAPRACFFVTMLWSSFFLLLLKSRCSADCLLLEEAGRYPSAVGDGVPDACWTMTQCAPRFGDGLGGIRPLGPLCPRRLFYPPCMIRKFAILVRGPLLL
jgi:hypothetical protein